MDSRRSERLLQGAILFARRDDNASRAWRWKYTANVVPWLWGSSWAREAVLHPQEQSYIGCWLREEEGEEEEEGDRSYGVNSLPLLLAVPERAAKFGDYLGLS